MSQPRRPGPLARYGPVATILACCAAVLTVVVVADPPETTTNGGVETTVGRGPTNLADIDNYPDGVIPYEKAKAEGAVDRYRWGDRCDTSTGLLAMPLAPQQPCMAPFTGDNGGATDTGVTDTSIKVVMYSSDPNDPILKFIYSQIGLDAPAGSTFTIYRNYSEIFSHYFELYGRKVELVPFTATGNIQDNVAATADAETIARDIKPFAVLGGPQFTDAFADTLAANGVMCIECTFPQTSQWFTDREPYVWGIMKDLDENFAMVGEYFGKRLKGKAEFAGDPDLRKRERRVAWIHAEAAEGSSSASEEFVSQLKERFNFEFVDVLTYTNPLGLEAEGRDMIAKLKDQGVTSVVLSTDPIAPQALTRIATEQEFFPEWVMSGQTLPESATFARTYDQKQWAHAFGPTNLFPRVKGGIGTPLALHTWWFGEEAPAGGSALLTIPNLQLLYSTLQGTGPKLTHEAFRDVLFGAPILPSSPVAPQISFGNRGFFPGTDHTALDDQTELWWDPDIETEDESGNLGKGAYFYSDKGKRYLLGQWPEEPPHAFDRANAVQSFDEVPVGAGAAPLPDYAPIAGPRKGRTG